MDLFYRCGGVNEEEIKTEIYNAMPQKIDILLNENVYIEMEYGEPPDSEDNIHIENSSPLSIPGLPGVYHYEKETPYIYNNYYLPAKTGTYRREDHVIFNKVKDF